MKQKTEQKKSLNQGGKNMTEEKSIDFFEYFIGPQHPGITGNFGVILNAVGDEIIKAQANPGYLHRAFEKLMEQRMYLQNVPLVCRICVPEPDVNEALYSMAIETLTGIEVPERAKYIRTIVLEMARLAAYLFYFGGTAATLGLYTLPNWSFGDRDYILDLFEELTGARIYHIYMQPGGVRRDLPKDFTKKLYSLLQTLKKRIKEYDGIFFDAALFKKRTKGVGVINKDMAIEYSVTGPNLRASGIAYDIRKDTPYLAYPDINFNVITENEGDFYSRVMVRRREFEEDIKILEQLIDKLPSGEVWNRYPMPLNWKVEKGDVYVKVESTKGEYGYYVVSDGSEKPRRIHVRGPSMTHGIMLLEKLLKGQRIADISPIMFSLDICPPDIDR